MSDFKVEVFRIDNVTKHPDADSLDITQVFGGYPCIMRRGDFKVGDLAIYIPVDVVLPCNELFSFLSSKDRKHLKAKRLRGIFSMGLIIPAQKDMYEGEDVTQKLGITRWEPQDPSMNRPGGKILAGDAEKDPTDFTFVHYTDIENARKTKYIQAFKEGEEVVIHEKIHGANFRVLHASKSDRLFVGSRQQNKRRPKEDNNRSSWWELAEKYDLEFKLKTFAPNLLFFGEMYGNVQDLKYGCSNDGKNSTKLALFDIFDIKKMIYLSYDEARRISDTLELPWVPTLYRGPWTKLDDFLHYAEGNSMVEGANNIREGFVIRPVNEAWDHRVGRKILKIHGQGFLLR
jgi:RNA ligase (TIGR02306 family)